MKALVVTPSHNSPLKGGRTKRDADEFKREAGRFVDVHASLAVRVEFPSLAPFGSRLKYLADEVKGQVTAPIDVAAIFCHGWRTGLQCGATLARVEEFAAILRGTGARHVILYACSAGRDADARQDDDVLAGPGGEGGFADALRDALGVDVWAHATDGHTTRNPFVRLFRGVEAGHGLGGEWHVEPGSDGWAAWRRALREHPTLRFTFPFTGATR